MTEEVKQFRDGIFALETRRFGTIGELMVSKLLELRPSGTLAYDLKEKDMRVECKFCRALQSHPKSIRANNLITEVLNARTEQRLISYHDESATWTVNFAQIKPECFDVLYFGVFFSDAILMFKMPSYMVRDIKGYSDKQHRGNKGEGQFSFKSKDLNEWLSKNIKRWVLDYEQLYQLFQSNG
jgi:hypothetical protein